MACSKIARGPGRRDDHEVAARVLGAGSMIDRHRLRPPDDRKVAERRHERQDTVPIKSMWTSGLSEIRPSSLRRRVAETIGGPRVSRLVNGQREQHDERTAMTAEMKSGD